MDRTKRLLEAGYFPSQLPPAFRTDDLALHYSPLLLEWAKIKPTKDGAPAKAPPAKAEVFSVARAGHRRRVTGITNPVAQTYLAHYVASNWGAILQHYRRSALSVSRPRITHAGERAAMLPSMKLHAEATLNKSAGYKFALRTDVSRFFPTIYTHSIPWALHGKVFSKSNRSTKAVFGNLLDEASRQLQDGQTIGLPIGPDTSHVIAEIIASAIDHDIVAAVKGSWSGFRYVDDYYLFFRTRSEADAALATITKSLRNYELQINFEKTRICETVDLSDDFWSHQLRSFTISSTGRSQARDLHHFFEFAKKLAKENADESVMLYAVKRASSNLIRLENWKAFVAHLCHVAIAFPNTLQQIARILATYRAVGYPTFVDSLQRMVDSIIDEHAPLEHHSEVAWCLWMSKSLGLALSAPNVILVSEMRSSACALLLLDLIDSGSITAIAPSPLWASLHTPDELYGDMWLLCYEAGMRSWGGFTPAVLMADAYFVELGKRDVHFYVPNAAMKPIFVIDAVALELATGKKEADWLSLFDDDEIDEYLEFDYDPGGYGVTVFPGHEEEEEQEGDKDDADEEEEAGDDEEDGEEGDEEIGDRFIDYWD